MIAGLSLNLFDGVSIVAYKMTVHAIWIGVAEDGTGEWLFCVIVDEFKGEG